MTWTQDVLESDLYQRDAHRDGPVGSRVVVTFHYLSFSPHEPPLRLHRNARGFLNGLLPLWASIEGHHKPPKSATERFAPRSPPPCKGISTLRGGSCEPGTAAHTCLRSGGVPNRIRTPPSRPSNRLD